MRVEEVNIQDIPEAKVFQKNDTIFINEKEYQLIIDYRDGFSCEVFQDRYTQLLEKYHYIVGDWGHEQLRLKGFYDNAQSNVDEEQKIKALEDYLREYCAFGCAYFVLKCKGEPVIYDVPRKNKSAKQQKRHYSNQKHRQNKYKKDFYHQSKRTDNKAKKHHFVIRQATQMNED